MAKLATTDAITLLGANHRSFNPSEFLGTVGVGRTIKKYRKNQKVFSQGDTADSVYFMHKGQVKVTVTSEHGKEAVIAILDKGKIFGEGSLSGQTRRIAAVFAMADCEITRIEKDVLVRTLQNEPSLSALFLEYMLKRTIRVEADLVDQLFNSSEKRLARALLNLTNCGQEGRPEPIIAKISQEILAEMIGSTRSRVSFFMNKFRKMGFIDYDGAMMTIHNSLLGVVLKDIPPHINADTESIRRNDSGDGLSPKVTLDERCLAHAVGRTIEAADHLNLL